MHRRSVPTRLELTLDLRQEPIIAMLSWGQESALLDFAPINLANIGPRLITTGSQELL